jgi:UDP-N-acetylglucosamine 1-carboxyvinyltransferase
VTGGQIVIKNADPEYLDMTALTFERLGITWEVSGQDIRVPANQSLTIVADLGNRLPEIKAQPWPAFPADLMSIALVVATQSVGTVLFHDWMYESRFFFTDKLARMGARITLCDPHRVLVQGPARLRGTPNITSPDIRAGMALFSRLTGAMSALKKSSRPSGRKYAACKQRTMKFCLPTSPHSQSHRRLLVLINFSKHLNSLPTNCAILRLSEQ